MDINKYIEKAHSIARSKGFWDKPREIGGLIMLTITEISEAVDADRKGRYADLEYFEKRLKETSETTNRALNYEVQTRHYQESFKKSFEHHIKDSVEDEIADTLIRMFDMFGGLKLEYVEPKRENKYYLDGSFDDDGIFVEDAMYVTSLLSKVYEAHLSKVDGLIRTYLCNTCYFLLELSKRMNIDIEAHIIHKMKYNSLRERLNGKSY
jgi:hypothetical protein